MRHICQFDLSNMALIVNNLQIVTNAESVYLYLWSYHLWCDMDHFECISLLLSASVQKSTKTSRDLSLRAPFWIREQLPVHQQHDKRSRLKMWCHLMCASHIQSLLPHTVRRSVAVSKQQQILSSSCISLTKINHGFIIEDLRGCQPSDNIQNYQILP